MSFEIAIPFWQIHIFYGLITSPHEPSAWGRSGLPRGTWNSSCLSSLRSFKSKLALELCISVLLHKSSSSGRFDLYAIFSLSILMIYNTQGTFLNGYCVTNLGQNSHSLSANSIDSVCGSDLLPLLGDGASSLHTASLDHNLA